LNTERTSSSALRSSVSSALRSVTFLRRFRVFFSWMAAALLLAGLAATASQAGLKSVSMSGTGAVLALAAQLRSARLHANAGTGGAAPSHTPGGRALLPRRMLHSGALVGRAAAAASVVPISGGVQTYDVDSPPPAFRPLIGYGSAAALNNSSTNPPVYISSLTPTNMTPVWSADETFLVYSSNRTQTGGVNADGTNPDGSTGPRFHLWAISVNGGEAFQITTSTGPANGGEFFPTLSQNNLTVAFTSDASSPDVQNLYAIAFSYSALSSGMVPPTNLSATAANPNPPVSLTLRGATELASAQATGFDQVQRPTFSPNDNQEIVFSAHSVNYSNNGDVNAGHNHLYFLYTSSGGFSPGQNVSFPGKLTNGPADDTDPTFAPDGSYIAFASTADVNGFTRNPNNAFGPTNPASVQDPNASQSLSSGTAATRSVFLISGGLSSTGVPFGTVPTALGTGGRVSLGSTAGFDDFGPAWSSFANQNQYTNPTGNSAYLAFARSTASSAALHDIYYFLAATGVSNPTTETLTRETAVGNAAVKLNTDDNAGETSAAGNVYDDIYPTWSPFLSLFSIAYSSNRTVTYNNPSGGAPVEVAASVPQGGAVTNSQDSTQNFSVGAGYAGLLVSQVLNLDPPTLLRFSTNEVLHVQAGTNPNPVTGTPNKLAATGGQNVTLTVRLSDRESGIDDTGGPGGGPRVYVQIKDPDSKYQDSQNTEHKVFMKDRRFDSQPEYDASGAPITDQAGNVLPGAQINARLSQFTSSTANGLLDVYHYYLPNSDLYSSLYYNPEGPLSIPSYHKYQYPSYGDNNDVVNMVGINAAAVRGVHGGQWIADTANSPYGTYIFVGKSGGGSDDGTDAGRVQPTDSGKNVPTGAPAAGMTPAVLASTYSYPVNGGRAFLPYPGSDPRQFVPTGPEYECQVVNPQFLTNGTTGDTQVGDPTVTAGYPAGYTIGKPTRDANGNITANGAQIPNRTGSVGDYVDPYYLAGVDDQRAFTGGTYGQNGTDRPVANYTAPGTARDVNKTQTTTTHPAEWLQLTRVPAAQQDNQGGVLYTVTWKTPLSGSDFFVDVIAYDKATFPNVPGANVGGRSNWRIYDNVGGFSTNQSIGSNDILVVSDYALGQKFAGTTFGGRNTNQNLVPKLFGTESYVTDVDINILPDSVYAGIPTTEKSYAFNAVVQPFLTDNTGFVLNPIRPNSFIFPVTQTAAENGLGVLSYQDGIINDGTTADGAPNVQSQRYSIWRILSRGPVPTSLLNSYLPTPVNQPAIADSAGINAPAATILEAPRCVLWLSPYTGDVLADPGTIDDPGNVGTTGVTNPRRSTTSILTAFAQAGGRLSVFGQDVGSTLTQNGTVANAPGAAGSPNFLPDVLGATLVPNTSGGNVLAGTDNRITGNPFYDHSNNGNYNTLTGPIQGGYTIQSPNYPYQDNLVVGDADYGDSGLSQIPALTVAGASVQGQTDVLTPSNTAQAAMTYGSGAGTAMVFHNDPYSPTGTHRLPNGGTGSRVVYAGFGLEGLTNDYYSSNQPNSSQSGVNGSLPLDELIPQVIPRNPRSAVLHNIVNYLRTGRVSGTITQTAGTGQGGGLGIDGVTVYLKPSTGTPPPTRAAFSALTANGGRFTIAGVEPGTYTLVAVKPGFQRAVSNSGVTYVVEGDTTATNATLTMTPQQPGNIAGTVHDTANNPINGSVVTFTSQDNSVTVAATSANGSVTGNTAENYFIQNVPVTNYTGKASSPTNPTGQAEYTPAATPDAPPAGSPATTPDYSKGVTVQPNTTVQPVNFTLTPILATIAGTVTNSVTGAVLPGATVTVTDSAGKTVGTPAVTAADGTYKLTGIPATQTAATYTLTATAPGFAASAPLAVPNVYLGSAITGANFALVPIAPGSITGTVTYTPGGIVSGPVAGAIVSYTAPGGTAQTVTTAADGTYTISPVPPAVYTVTAVGPLNANGKPTTMAAAAQQITVTSGNASTANFQVTPIAPSFSGTVVSAAVPGPPSVPSKPLANATITITGTDAAGTAIAPITVKTAADGTYTTGPLAPGTYTLTASLAGYASSAPLGPTTVQLGDVITGDNFTLTAVPPGSITGTVLDNQGHPVSGATVTFTSQDGTVPNQTAQTNPDGTYFIPPTGTKANVPATTYTGTATGTRNETGTPQYGSAPPQTVTVTGGSSVTANFVLPVIPATVSGTVTDIQTSGGVSGATVTLTDPSGKVVGGPIVTGAGGTFSFTGILALQGTQNYTLTATAPNYFPAAAPVVLSLGDMLTGIALTLNEQATLVGLVTDGSPDATGQPLSGVTITVTDASGNAVTTTPAPVTTQSGTLAAPDGQPENYTATLLPGKYTITAAKGSYVSQTTALITLTNTAPVRVNFALVSSIGTLGGLVTDQNGTGLVSGATVTAVPTGSTTGLTFTTSASSTPGPDGAPLNYSGQLAQGTYTVTVTKGSRTSAAQKVTIAGGTFKRLDFTAANGLPALHLFPAGIQFVSTPYDYSSLGFSGLFGALNTAPAGTTANGNRSNVAVWNPLTGAYALDPNAPADALRLGVGYWVYLKNPAAVTQQGATPTAKFVAVSLGQGWNQIGVPNPSTAGTPIASLMFDNGTGGMITFAQASGPQYNLVTHPLYGYAGGGYQALSTTGVLTPWNGYWIYVNAAATLEIPTQATTTTTTTTTTPPVP